MKQRIVSILLCLCMAVSLLPTTARAEEPADPVGVGTARPQETEQTETADLPGGADVLLFFGVAPDHVLREFL